MVSRYGYDDESDYGNDPSSNDYVSEMESNRNREFAAEADKRQRERMKAETSKACKWS